MTHFNPNCFLLETLFIFRSAICKANAHCLRLTTRPKNFVVLARSKQPILLLSVHLQDVPIGEQKSVLITDYHWAGRNSNSRYSHPKQRSQLATIATAHKWSSKALRVESSRKGLEEVRELSMAMELRVAMAAHSASKGSSKKKVG